MATGILLNVANMAVDPLIEPDIIFIIFAMIRISSVRGKIFNFSTISIQSGFEF